MKFLIEVDNIKCSGCASQIVKKLSALAGVSAVKVDVEKGLVTGEKLDEDFAEIKAKLASMGYPETGSQHGLEAVGSKAKSFVSCAIGSMTKDE